ncbi:multidrug effflux MFS transporter [Legionella nagasakiensis]|uniref:multidrug effflux MFS transporter n=1 Tax=Legionella nagasakiensis TaxID=535290 RepID=UPI001054989C|nr:multidrug effflux MFS transporter [Legionella nagasakiensis]
MNKGLKKDSVTYRISLLAIILLVSSLGQVTSDLYLPSLPSMAKSLSVNASWIQFTIAIYMAGFSISQLIYGPWSDAVGRRVPLLVGLFINFIGSLICWLSPSIYLLFLGRFLQGLGVGAGYTLARPILRDLFEKEALAVYNSYLAVSTVFILSTAPILGGYIQQYAGWRYNFLFLSLYGLLILYFFYRKVSETSQYHHKDNFRFNVILTNANTLLKHPIFLRFSLCPLLTYAGIVAWLTVVPILLQEQLGLSPVQFGWLYIFSGIGFAVGGFLNMRFVMKFGIDKMMVLGFLCQLGAGLIMLLFYLFGYMNTWVIVAPILLFMMGSSLIFPNSSAGALMPFPKIAGTAGALFGFMQIFGGALSSSIMALLHDQTQLPLAIAFISMALLSILVFYGVKSKS